MGSPALIPPLPPGFRLDEDLPPLPPGFTLDGDAPAPVAPAPQRSMMERTQPTAEELQLGLDAQSRTGMTPGGYLRDLNQQAALAEAPPPVRETPNQRLRRIQAEVETTTNERPSSEYTLPSRTERAVEWAETPAWSGPTRLAADIRSGRAQERSIASRVAGRTVTPPSVVNELAAFGSEVAGGLTTPVNLGLTAATLGTGALARGATVAAGNALTAARLGETSADLAVAARSARALTRVERLRKVTDAAVAGLGVPAAISGTRDLSEGLVSGDPAKIMIGAIETGMGSAMALHGGRGLGRETGGVERSIRGRQAAFADAERMLAERTRGEVPRETVPEPPRGPVEVPAESFRGRVPLEPQPVEIGPGRVVGEENLARIRQGPQDLIIPGEAPPGVLDVVEQPRAEYRPPGGRVASLPGDELTSREYLAGERRRLLTERPWTSETGAMRIRPEKTAMRVSTPQGPGTIAGGGRVRLDSGGWLDDLTDVKPLRSEGAFAESGPAPRPSVSPTTASVVEHATAEGPPTYGKIRRAYRTMKQAMKPNLEVLDTIEGAGGAKTGKDIADALRSFHHDWEISASRATGTLEEILRPFSPEQEVKIIDTLEGKVSSDPEIRHAANRIRTLLNDVASSADAEGALVGFRENYFPHKNVETGKWDFQDAAAKIAESEKIPIDEATRRLNRAIQYAPDLDPHLQRIRKDLNRTNYRKDMGVLREYIVDSYKTVSKARNLGQNLEKVRPLLDEIPRLQRASRPGLFDERQYAETSVLRNIGEEPITAAGEASGLARKIQATVHLGLGAIAQTGSVAQTIKEAGTGPAAKALFKVSREIGAEKVKHFFETGSLRGPEVAGGRRLTPTEIGAVKSGSLWSHIANEFYETSGKKRGFIYGTATVDRFMRVVANQTAEPLINSLRKSGHLGDLSKALTKVELDHLKAGGKITEEIRLKVGRHVSDATQYRTGVDVTPLWGSSPAGRLALQFNNFMYQQARDVFKTTGKVGRALKAGDVSEAAWGIRKLARYAASAEVVGELGNDVKAWIKQVGEAEEPQGVIDATKKIMGSRRIGWEHPVLRALQNIASVGGLGIVQTVIQDAMNENPAVAAAGPTAGDVVQAGKTISAGLNRGPAAFAREAGRFAAHQVPIFGYEIGRELFNKELPTQAQRGTIGKGLDWMFSDRARQRAWR